MSTFILQLISGGYGLLGSLAGLAMLAINIWFIVDSIRRGEYLWTVFLLLFPLLNIILYYLFVIRPSGAGNPLAGFELPGAADRRRIKQLQADIHYLDRANQHLELADIYMSQGKLDLAEKSYRAAYERDPKDEDIRAHLGNCLARRNKAQEGLPLLESVCATNPKHDYGYTLMALAEAQGAVGQIDKALATWQQVLSMYAYSRARVQYADLLIQKKQYPEAHKQLQGVIDDYPFTPKFQQKKEAVWLRRACDLMGKIPNA
jgi:hypothetical protein